LRAHMRVDELADFFPAYPTASELLPETVRGGAV
jgi:hypothetical protein